MSRGLSAYGTSVARVATATVAEHDTQRVLAAPGVTVLAAQGIASRATMSS
jgi:hypothetical protein